MGALYEERHKSCDAPQLVVSEVIDFAEVRRSFLPKNIQVSAEDQHLAVRVKRGERAHDTRYTAAYNRYASL